MVNSEVDPMFLPAHVPRAFVRTVAGAQDALAKCPHLALAKADAGDRITYRVDQINPSGEHGYWAPAQAQDMREILLAPEIFSSVGVAGFSALMGESWPLIPAELDPPAHTSYRQFLNPIFSQAAVRPLAAGVREHAVRLINQLAKGGSCEFQAGFAQPFPILIFLLLMGLPQERFGDILEWGHDLHEGENIQQRARGALAIGAFLREQIEVVRGKPRGDVLTKIVHGEIAGQRFSDDEIIGMVYLVFAGGIHTVTASLGYQFEHLGRDQALQARLRASPELIPAAVEELLRIYSVVNSFRRVTRDVDIAGVTMKAGDWVQVTLPLVNYDDAAFPDAATVDIARKPNRHLAFSAGIHFCLGAPLARQEMVIAWEEWLNRIPPFRTREDETQFHVGGLMGIDRLVLDWS